MTRLTGHRASGAPSGAWTPSGCCSRPKCDHPRAAYRRRSNVADPAGSLSRKRKRERARTIVSHAFIIFISYTTTARARTVRIPPRAPLRPPRPARAPRIPQFTPPLPRAPPARPPRAQNPIPIPPSHRKRPCRASAPLHLPPIAPSSQITIATSRLENSKSTHPPCPESSP